MRQFHAEQTADDDGVRMPLHDLLGLTLNRCQGIGKHRYAGCAGGPGRAFEALPAFQSAVAEAVGERLLVRTENVDTEYPVTFDQREGRGLTVDADQQPRRVRAQ